MHIPTVSGALVSAMPVSAAPLSSRDAAKPAAYYKEVILAVLFVLAHAGTFFLWKQILPSVIAGDFAGYYRFIYPVVALAASAILFSLAAIFIRTALIMYPAAIVSAAVPYLLLPAENVVLGALGANILLVVFAVYRIRKEFLFSVGFGVSKILKLGLPFYFTSAALIVSVFYIYAIDKKDVVAVFLPKPLLDFTLNHLLASQYIESLIGLPEISRDSTVNDIIDALISDQLKNQKVALSKVPAEELTKLRNLQREEMSRQFGTALKGDEKIGDVFYMMIAARVEDLLGPYKKYLPYAGGIAFFFAFKALTLPLYFVSLFLTFLLIKLLVFGKVIKTAIYQIEVEKLSL
ncbi:MAG: hypothetical protein G01um101433_923 [Parcubacteria group bacterium Gr01-1014_33]|nr:MAG: hypothetical protein G01um101433_923 [Parcubacteria group bacterium Gr01-1014_33]